MMMSTHNDQVAVIAFLSDPSSYGSDVKTVDRIDTHCSVVFLAGNRAFKLKRAVRFSYLDYSTADLRGQACDAELVLNRRTAPGLYLEVRSIRRSFGDRLMFDGAGEILDWVVVMRRFDQSAVFDRMIARDALTPALMRDLADVIAEFHSHAEIDHSEGGRRALEWILWSNDANLRLDRLGIFPVHLVDDLNQSSRAALDRVAAILDRRRAGGHVRLCHGDLHLRNICLIEGRPTLFDGIEFSRSIACIDVLYDLAFLLMDLEQHGRRDFANLVLNRYLDLTGEADGLATLPLFMSARAVVRAHTTMASMDRQKDERAKASTGILARSCFELAQAFLMPVPARLVAIGGLSGTGKSTLANTLAPALGRSPGARVLRSDVVRKRLFGVRPETPLSEAAYAPAATEDVYGMLRSIAADALGAGQSVIVDAVFAQPEHRDAVEGVARAGGTNFVGIWLKGPAEVLVERVGARRGDASDASPEVVRRQLGYDTGSIAWHRIDASGAISTVVEKAHRILADSAIQPPSRNPR